MSTTRNADRLAFVRATPADAHRLAAHEQRVADPRLYGPPLDRDACAREITNNILYFVETDGALVATAAWSLRDDGSAYLCNIAVTQTSAVAASPVRDAFPSGGSEGLRPH